MGNQWQDDVHVLNSLVKGHEGSPVLDFFVLGTLWVALFGLHFLDKRHEVLGINLVPKSGLPGLELVVNEGNEIPHLLEEAKFLRAVVQLLVGRLLDIEKGLKIVEITGLFLELTSFDVVLADRVIRLVDDFWGRVHDVVWASIAELHSVFLNLNLELSESILNVGCLLSLEWENSFLDWSKSFLTDINKSGLGVLKLHQVVLVHLQLMLFEEHDGLLHWLNLG